MKTKHAGLALLLLAAFVSAQFIWQAAEGNNRSPAWTGSQGSFSALLLALVWLAYPAWPMRAVCLLAGLCQALTAWCSIKWLIQPWIPTGRDQCSGAFDFPVGVLAALLALVLAWRIYVGGRDGR